jgi:hypothetical protein
VRDLAAKKGRGVRLEVIKYSRKDQPEIGSKSKNEGKIEET